MAQASGEAGMDEQKENCFCAYGGVGGKPRARYDCTVSLPLLGISEFAAIICEHESQLDRFNCNHRLLGDGKSGSRCKLLGKEVYQESKTSMREAKNKSHVLRLFHPRIRCSFRCENFHRMLSKAADTKLRGAQRSTELGRLV